MLRKVDIFGSRYEFHLLGNSSFKSILGGVISCFSLILFIILFMMLGKNFYQRENPITSMSKEYSKNYFNYTLQPSSFLFGFQIVDQDSNLYDRPDIFYIEPHYLVYKKSNEGKNIKIEDRILKYHRCTDSDTNFNHEYLSNQLYTYYCFDEINKITGIDIGGLWDAMEFKYIKIKVKHCTTAGDYNKENNITCSTNKTEMETIMKSYKYFQIFIQNYFLNSNVYDDPFKLSLNVLYETMDLKVQKKMYYYFKTGVFEDKKGWFTEESDKKTLIGIDRTRSDFMNGVGDYFSTTYYETNLYFDKIIETYNRRYMKIQEVIANIGGIMKFIFFIASFLVSFYNNFLMYKRIVLEVVNRNIFKDMIVIKRRITNTNFKNAFNNIINNANDSYSNRIRTEYNNKMINNFIDSNNGSNIKKFNEWSKEVPEINISPDKINKKNSKDNQNENHLSNLQDSNVNNSNFLGINDNSNSIFGLDGKSSDLKRESTIRNENKELKFNSNNFGEMKNVGEKDNNYLSPKKKFIFENDSRILLKSQNESIVIRNRISNNIAKQSSINIFKYSESKNGIVDANKTDKIPALEKTSEKIINQEKERKKAPNNISFFGYFSNLYKKKKEKSVLNFFKIKKAIDDCLDITNLLSVLNEIKEINQNFFQCLNK